MNEIGSSMSFLAAGPWLHTPTMLHDKELESRDW